MYLDHRDYSLLTEPKRWDLGYSWLVQITFKGELEKLESLCELDYLFHSEDQIDSNTRIKLIRELVRLFVGKPRLTFQELGVIIGSYELLLKNRITISPQLQQLFNEFSSYSLQNNIVDAMDSICNYLQPILDLLNNTRVNGRLYPKAWAIKYDGEHLQLSQGSRLYRSTRKKKG